MDCNTTIQHAQYPPALERGVCALQLHCEQLNVAREELKAESDALRAEQDKLREVVAVTRILTPKVEEAMREKTAVRELAKLMAAGGPKAQRVINKVAHIKRTLQNFCDAKYASSDEEEEPKDSVEQDAILIRRFEPFLDERRAKLEGGGQKAQPPQPTEGVSGL